MGRDCTTFITIPHPDPALARNALLQASKGLGNGRSAEILGELARHAVASPGLLLWGAYWKNHSASELAEGLSPALPSLIGKTDRRIVLRGEEEEFRFLVEVSWCDPQIWESLPRGVWQGLGDGYAMRMTSADVSWSDSYGDDYESTPRWPPLFRGETLGEVPDTVANTFTLSFGRGRVPVAQTTRARTAEGRAVSAMLEQAWQCENGELGLGGYHGPPLQVAQVVKALRRRCRNPSRDDAVLLSCHAPHEPLLTVRIRKSVDVVREPVSLDLAPELLPR